MKFFIWKIFSDYFHGIFDWFSKKKKYSIVIFKYFNGNFVLEIFLWFVIRKTSISSNGNLNNQVHESTQRYHVQVFLHIHEKATTKIYEECDLCHRA